MFINFSPFLRRVLPASSEANEDKEPQVQILAPKPMRAGVFEAALEELEQNAMRCSLLDEVMATIESRKEEDIMQPFWLMSSSEDSIVSGPEHDCSGSAPSLNSLATGINADASMAVLTSDKGSASSRAGTPAYPVDHLGQYITNYGHFDPFGNTDVFESDSPYEPRTARAFQPGLGSYSGALDLDFGCGDGTCDDFPAYLLLDKFVEEGEEELDAIFSARVDEPKVAPSVSATVPLPDIDRGLMPAGFGNVLGIETEYGAQAFCAGYEAPAPERFMENGPTYRSIWDSAGSYGPVSVPGEFQGIVDLEGEGGGVTVKRAGSYKGSYLELPVFDEDQEAESDDEDSASIMTAVSSDEEDTLVSMPGTPVDFDAELPGSASAEVFGKTFEPDSVEGGLYDCKVAIGERFERLSRSRLLFAV